MIIYIEGVDGSGKTTLINILTERIKQLEDLKKVKLVEHAEELIPTHPKRQDRIIKEKLITELQRMNSEITTIYLIDRGPISDIIYRTFDEHKPIMTMYELQQLYSVLDNMFIVHCDSDKSFDAMTKRGDENNISIKYHSELRYLFNQVMPTFNSFKIDMFAEDQVKRKVDYLLAYLWGIIDLRRP